MKIYDGTMNCFCEGDKCDGVKCDCACHSPEWLKKFIWWFQDRLGR